MVATWHTHEAQEEGVVSGGGGVVCCGELAEVVGAWDGSSRIVWWRGLLWWRVTLEGAVALWFESFTGQNTEKRRCHASVGVDHRGVCGFRVW